VKTFQIGLVCVVAIALVGMCVPALADGGAKVLDHKVKNIDGKEVDLAKYKGKVVMIVNVASECGLTPQYKQLVEIHKKYKKAGFDILGFPANNFGEQEPGTNAQIKTFCTTQHNVEFSMFAKISVKGDDQAALYKELTSKEKNGEFGGEITWNFSKFLVNRDGQVVARFDPRTKPDAPEVVAAIEKELKVKPEAKS